MSETTRLGSEPFPSPVVAAASRSRRLSPRAVAWLLPAAVALGVAGCGHDGPETKVVHGTVSFEGEEAESGEVRFVPVEGTLGPTSVAPIIEGQYRIDARGGVPLGKHRIEVDARKKTGKKVEQYNGFETTLVDETVRLGPESVAGADSPLTADVSEDSDGQINIEIPNS